MALFAPVFRMLLVALVCAGFCGLEWNQLSAAPTATTREQVIQEARHGDSRLFANSHQESLGSVGQPDRAEIVPFVFDAGKESAVVPPVFAVVAKTDAAEPMGQSDWRKCVKNKGPPAV